MKYIKKFNEELNPSTYLSASDKLKELDHHSRAQDLFYWAQKRKSDEYVKGLPDRIKKLGSVPVDIEGNAVNCYLDIEFLDDMLINSIRSLFYGKKEYIELVFTINYIPSDTKSHFVLSDTIRKFDDHGVISFVSVRYVIKDAELNISNITISEYDYSVSKNRRLLYVIKKRLLDCLSSGDIYERIRDILNKENITLEYGLKVDDIYDDVNSFSLNKVKTRIDNSNPDIDEVDLNGHPYF